MRFSSCRAFAKWKLMLEGEGVHVAMVFNCETFYIDLIGLSCRSKLWCSYRQCQCRGWIWHKGRNNFVHAGVQRLNSQNLGPDHASLHKIESASSPAVHASLMNRSRWLNVYSPQDWGRDCPQDTDYETKLISRQCVNRPRQEPPLNHFKNK